MNVSHYEWGKIEFKFPKRIHKNYTLGKFINDGKSASVYLLENKNGLENIALKIQLIDSKKTFNNEIKIALLFNEFNIGPKVYDHWITSACGSQASNGVKMYGFITMEYWNAELPPLWDSKNKLVSSDYHKLKDNLKIRDVIIKQIKTIHNQGYLHLDISETNILIRGKFQDLENDNVTIADFGLSTKIKNVHEKLIERIYTNLIDWPQTGDYFKYKQITLTKLIQNPKLIDYSFVWFVWKIDMDEK